MSNSRKKRIQANYTRRQETLKRLAYVRQAYVHKIWWVKFVQWLKSLFRR